MTANAVDCADEKRQLFHRHPLHFVQQTLHAFNSGHIEAAQACHLLHVGKTRLYQLRTRWLQNRKAFHLDSSGGNKRGSWPEPAIAFLREFIPLQTPCNFQLVADELLASTASNAPAPASKPTSKPTCPTSSPQVDQISGALHPHGFSRQDQLTANFYRIKIAPPLPMWNCRVLRAKIQIVRLTRMRRSCSSITSVAERRTMIYQLES